MDDSVFGLTLTRFRSLCGVALIYKAWLKQDLSQEVRRIHSTGAVDGAGKGGTLGGGSK